VDFFRSIFHFFVSVVSVKFWNQLVEVVHGVQMFFVENAAVVFVYTFGPLVREFIEFLTEFAVSFCPAGCAPARLFEGLVFTDGGLFHNFRDGNVFCLHGFEAVRED